MDQAIDTAKDAHVITYTPDSLMKVNKETRSYFSSKKLRRREKFHITCSCSPQMEISSSGQTAWEFAVKRHTVHNSGCWAGLQDLICRKSPGAAWDYLYDAKACCYFESFEPSTAEGSTYNNKFCVNYMKMMPVNARMLARVCEGIALEHISLLFFWQSRWLSQGKAFDACC